jgi:uncharacterized protein YybS (DUF2232 family)
VGNFMQTSAIKDSVITMLILAVLGLVGIYIPSLMIIIQLFWAVPLIIVSVCHGLTVGFYTALAVGLIHFFLLGPAQASILFLQYAGISFVYGLTIRRGLKPGISMVMGAVAVIISFALVALLLISVLGFEPNYFSRQLQASIDPLIEMYRAEGLFNTDYPFLTEETLREQLEELVVFLTRLFPAFFALWGALLATTNYLIARRALKRIAPARVFPPFSPLKEWRLPWWIVWGFLGGYGAYLLGDYYQIEGLLAVGQNIIMVYLPVFFILGCAVLSFLFGKYNMSRALPWVFLCLFLLFGLLPLAIIAGVGLMDLLFNYRRKAESKPS